MVEALNRATPLRDATLQRFNRIELIVRVARGEHGGETGDFFLAPAHGAGLLVLAAVANDLERAFTVDFFLQSPQRTIHRFAFF